eukprot:5679025-Alexandrium_andersonii.AAC.1
MSASLVGSEMCIRDRSVQPATVQPRTARATHIAPPARGKKHHRTAKAAVSYTHLTLPTICSV